MDKYIDLYNFIDLAKTNRKYPESTANNLKSALKIFEKELNKEELRSINMVQESVNEIFRSVVIANKEKSIVSLNTYKARLLKVIKDYKKYGINPSKMQSWSIKPRKPSSTLNIKQTDNNQTYQSTGVLIKKDKKDKDENSLSNSIYDTVDNYYKIELSFKNNQKISISLPKNISHKEVEIINKILISLSE